MDIDQVFLFSIVVSAVLHWALGVLWISVLVPVLGFVGYVEFAEFTQPYQGGGASMWPLAVLFVAMAAGSGAYIGALFGDFLRKRLPSPLARRSPDEER